MNPGTENEEIEIIGSYSYIGDNGVLYNVYYKSGRNGYETSANPFGVEILPDAGFAPGAGFSPNLVKSLLG